MEIQERGSPHIHIVLWTEESIDYLASIPHFIVAQKPHSSDPIFHLVTQLQTHRCSPYCLTDADPRCRFGFPFEPTPETYKQDNRFFYKRNVGDENIAPYNPFLLALCRTHMNIQLNEGRSALYYLCKYMTKQDSTRTITLHPTNPDTPQHHFKTRIVGAVEACFDILSLHKHKSSTGVVYLNTNLPINERRLLRHDYLTLPSSSTNIYTKTQLGKIYPNPAAYY
ncbi:hypothetical protein BCR43DRAFT_438670 [Syncephalastrum racemosum]|uniref:Helitron helicase-like domain-containing protein n=1 Tax=Syncephalastrum racemosum TaxID=13706 RepID=A0A1X2HE00_SYNRA|nr:hypothetical protein BCR43DRAFT_438670 [Syncephalastrum racemosum]